MLSWPMERQSPRRPRLIAVKGSASWAMERQPRCKPKASSLPANSRKNDPKKLFLFAVKRNPSRSPEDFMFQLSTQEYDDLRSQIVTSTGKTGRRQPPYSFTEQGIAMLSGVLRSERAIKVNVEIMRVKRRLTCMTPLSAGHTLMTSIMFPQNRLKRFLKNLGWIKK